MKRQDKKHKADFIDEKYIFNLLERAKSAPQQEARQIIQKGRDAKGLTPYETAVLLQCDEPEIKSLLFEAAHEVKQKIYGKRLVFFAPLYISNYCINNCTYCGYRKSNTIVRRRLDFNEIENEIIALETMGHKRLALETGEDPVNCPIEYVLNSIKKIYEVKDKTGSIRRDRSR
jgi:2-iminoacetate synthase